jgi:hypothetical protein
MHSWNYCFILQSNWSAEPEFLRLLADTGFDALITRLDWEGGPQCSQCLASVSSTAELHVTELLLKIDCSTNCSCLALEQRRCLRNLINFFVRRIYKLWHRIRKALLILPPTLIHFTFYSPFLPSPCLISPFLRSFQYFHLLYFTFCLFLFPFVLAFSLPPFFIYIFFLMLSISLFLTLRLSFLTFRSLSLPYFPFFILLSFLSLSGYYFSIISALTEHN